AIEDLRFAIVQPYADVVLRSSETETVQRNNSVAVPDDPSRIDDWRLQTDKRVLGDCRGPRNAGQKDEVSTKRGEDCNGCDPESGNAGQKKNDCQRCDRAAEPRIPGRAEANFGVRC